MEGEMVKVSSIMLMVESIKEPGSMTKFKGSELKKVPSFMKENGSKVSGMEKDSSEFRTVHFRDNLLMEKLMVSVSSKTIS